VVIGTVMVKNSQETVKTAKITVVVPIVTCLLRVRRIQKARAAASSTLEEWTRTFSRGQQCTVVLELPYSTEFGRGRAAIQRMEIKHVPGYSPMSLVLIL